MLSHTSHTHTPTHTHTHTPPHPHSEVVECDLVFVGLIVMQNRLKPETTPVISTLTSAALRTIMITGELLFCLH